MKLSIAFITNNRKEELLRAILSCQNNINNIINTKEAEYIIIDNASTDGTEKFIKTNVNIKNLQYKYSSENLGVSGGRNLAFCLCKGDYVFFLDDDAIIASNYFFDSLISFMDKNNDIVAVSPDIQEPLTNSNLNSNNNCIEGQLNLILSFCGCAHMLRRNFFKNIVLYPDNLKFGSEELYASIQAYSLDKLVVQYDKVKVEHYPSTVNRFVGDERKFNFIFNQYIIKKLLYPKIVLWITWFFYILHRVKHGYCSKKWKRQAKEYYIERFDKSYINRINIKNWIKLIKRFGWRATI